MCKVAKKGKMLEEEEEDQKASVATVTTKNTFINVRL